MVLKVFQTLMMSIMTISVVVLVIEALRNQAKDHQNSLLSNSSTPVYFQCEITRKVFERITPFSGFLKLKNDVVSHSQLSATGDWLSSTTNISGLNVVASGEFAYRIGGQEDDAIHVSLESSLILNRFTLDYTIVDAEQSIRPVYGEGRCKKVDYKIAPWRE